MEKTKAKKKLHVPKGLVDGLRLEHVLGPLGRTADVTLTMNGPPMGLAVAQRRKNDVRRDVSGKRIATLEELFADQSCSLTLVMFNNRAFDDRFPWAAFDLVGYEAIVGAETETHIGPWPMGDIGDKTCAGTFFCAHFKGPLCVYKLGQLLGTNINLNEWKPSRPTPAKKYWDKLRDDGVIQEGLAVKDFKKSAKFKKKQKDFQQYLNTIQAERRGDCEKCKMVRNSGLKTY